MISLLLIVQLTLIGGCKKLIDVSAPTTQLVTSSVFASDASASAAMAGIYSKLMESGASIFSGGGGSVGPLCGLAADELVNYSVDGNYGQFYKNAIAPTNAVLTNSLWGTAYQTLYAVNAVLEGIEGSTALSAPVRQQLTGEAKFLRAFTNFYLLQLFDSIPLITTTNYTLNQQATRATVAGIMQQITTDLLDAYVDLANVPVAPGAVRANALTVRFLQARIALYAQDWSSALNDCNAIIGAGYSLQTDLDQVFLASSAETIFQLAPVQPELNTFDGDYYILLDIPSQAALSPVLLHAFEVGDLRRLHWTDSLIVSNQTYFFPFKYKIKTGSPVTEDQIVFRLAEILLIHAEALAHTGDLVGADADLNQLRARAGRADVTSATLADFDQHLLHERQVELFTEWGHRWLDLKRLGVIDATLSGEKGDWQPTDAWFPIPQTEIQKDPNLIQNAGY